jgi:hypothetical protein
LAAIAWPLRLARAGGSNTEIDGTDQAPAIAAAQTSGDNAAQQREALQQRLNQPGGQATANAHRN